MQILAGRGGGEDLGGAGGRNYNHSILYGKNLLKIKKDSSYSLHVVANAWISALGRLKQKESCQCKVHPGNIVKRDSPEDLYLVCQLPSPRLVLSLVAEVYPSEFR